VTLVLAMVLGKGVVVAADTRVSGYGVYGEERKVYPVTYEDNGREYGLAVVSGAGVSALVKGAYELIRNKYTNLMEHVKSKEGAARNPNKREVEAIVRETEVELMSRYSKLRELGMTDFPDILLATVTCEGEPLLYLFEAGLANPMHEAPGYVILGHGELTGARLLLTLLGYKAREKQYWDHSILPVFIIDVVSAVDPTVSPFSDPHSSIYIRYSEESKTVVAGPLTPEAFKTAKNSVQKRIKAFQLIWELMEKEGEEKILKTLKKRLEKLEE